MPGVLSTASNFVCKGFGLYSAVPRSSIASTMRSQVGTICPLPDTFQPHGTEACNSPVRENVQNFKNKSDSEPPQIPDSQIGLSPTDTESFLSRTRSRIVSFLSWLREMFFPRRRRETNNSISLARILVLNYCIPAVFRSIYRQISNALTSIICRRTRENSSPAPTVPAVKYTSEKTQDKSDAGTQTTEGEQRLNGQALVQTVHGGPEPESQEKLDPSDSGTQTTEGEQSFNGQTVVHTVHGGPEPEPQDKLDPSDTETQSTEGDQGFEEQALVQTLHGGPEPESQDKIDPSDAGTQSTEGEQRLNGQALVQTLHGGPEPESQEKLDPSDAGTQFTEEEQKINGQALPQTIYGGPEPEPQEKLDPSFSDTPAEKQTLVIGCSIVQNVALRSPATTVKCIPGATADGIEFYLKLLSNAKVKYSTIVIHVGSNDARLCQSETTKINVASVCNFAKTMSDSVVFSGPLPDLTCDEMFSRISWFHLWLSRWCPENNVDYIDNWSAFWGKPGLLQSDGIHPTLTGAALLSRNLDNFFEGQQRFNGLAVIQNAHDGPDPVPESSEQLDPIDAGTQSSEEGQRFDGQTVVQKVHGGPETSLSSTMSVSFCLDQPQSNQENHGLPINLGGPEAEPQEKLDPSLSDTPAEKQTLVIGCSIVQNVALRSPATTVKCIPGATADGIELYLKLLSNAKVKYSTIVIHVGSNDARLCQSETTKINVASVCNFAKTMSDSVVFSGPLPDLTCDEMFSRISWFHLWLSRWCPENNVDYIDNWSAFWGEPGLLQSDGIHPTLTGAALLSRNLDKIFEGQQRFNGPAVIQNAHDGPDPVPESSEQLDPLNAGTQSSEEGQRFDGQTVVQKVHGGPETSLSSPMSVSFCLDQPQSNQENHGLPMTLGGPQAEPEKQTLIIGCSIVRDVALGTPASIVKCILGATVNDIESYLKLLSNAKVKYSTIVIHIGSNDARLRQSEITKIKVASMCNFAKTMSDSVVFSGPLPDLTCDEMFSRMMWFNRWLSRWCPENNVGYVDNWSDFCGEPGLLQRDGIHPTLAGAALLSRNLDKFFKGQQRFDGPAVIQNAHDGPDPVPESLEQLDPSDARTQSSEGDQRFDGQTVFQKVHGGPETSLSSTTSVSFCLDQPQSNQENHGLPMNLGGPEPEAEPQEKLDPSLSDTSAEKQTLVIGCSIVQNVALRSPATTVKCIPGATADGIELYLKLLSNAKVKYSTIVIHVGSNDARLRQSEITKIKVASMCNFAKTMSDSVVFSGSLPDLTCDEMFSRMMWFNRWLSRWCPENNVGYVDNWSDFCGEPGLLQRDGIHPTLAGAALLSRNLDKIFEGQQRFDAPAVIQNAHDGPDPVPESLEQLDPSDARTQSSEGDQRFDGPAAVQIVYQNKKKKKKTKQKSVVMSIGLPPFRN